jgi:hypothetical protein
MLGVLPLQPDEAKLQKNGIYSYLLSLPDFLNG